MVIGLMVLFIRYSENLKPLKGLLTKAINENLVDQIQANILHYSLNNTKDTFRLPCILVTRPVGTHMISLARILAEVLKFQNELVKNVSTNCWSTIFL